MNVIACMGVSKTYTTHVQAVLDTPNCVYGHLHRRIILYVAKNSRPRAWVPFVDVIKDNLGFTPLRCVHGHPSCMYMGVSVTYTMYRFIRLYISHIYLHSYYGIVRFLTICMPTLRLYEVLNWATREYFHFFSGTTSHCKYFMNSLVWSETT